MNDGSTSPAQAGTIVGGSGQPLQVHVEDGEQEWAEPHRGHGDAGERDDGGRGVECAAWSQRGEDAERQREEERDDHRGRGERDRRRERLDDQRGDGAALVGAGVAERAVGDVLQEAAELHDQRSGRDPCSDASRACRSGSARSPSRLSTGSPGMRWTSRKTSTETPNTAVRLDRRRRRRKLARMHRGQKGVRLGRAELRGGAVAVVERQVAARRRTYR